jgi:hypothetical protein
MSNRSASAVCVLMVGVLALVGCSTGLLQVSKPESSKPLIVPMPDPASMQQVIDPAKEFVILNHLQDVSGTFGWVACGGQHEALYYGEARVYFGLPKGMDSQGYVQKIAHMMVSHGWSDAPAQGNRSFGTLLHTNEVRAIITGGNANDPETGQVQLLGECRNTADHRDDSTAVSITSQLLQR